MSNIFSNVSGLSTDVVDYVNLQKDLIKLQVTEKSTKVISNIITYVILGIIGILVLICVSVGFAWLINSKMDSQFAGFFIVGGVYALLAIILYISRKTLITNKIADKLTDIIIN